MEKNSIKHKIIEQVCKEKGIDRVNLSYDWITILKKDEKQRKIINYNFDLNTAVSQKLANDKYSTYSILKFYEIPVIEHNILCNEKIMPDSAFLNEDYKVLKNNEKIVIKANNSSQGKDVYVCNDKNQKFQIVNKLFEEGKDSVIICPYIDIEYEYRAIFLDGEVIYIYKKEKPFVIGDGKLNVAELINKNLKYLHEPLENLDFNFIPEVNEKITVGWKHNLNNGAIPVLVNEKDLYYEKIKNIAINAANSLDLKIAAVDIVLNKSKELQVMEVNASNVVVNKFCELVPNGFEIGKQIYSKIIDKMFEK